MLLPCSCKSLRKACAPSLPVSASHLLLAAVTWRIAFIIGEQHQQKSKRKKATGLAIPGAHLLPLKAE